jgi:tetratricopeptide (TPR) repeat protein
LKVSGYRVNIIGNKAFKNSLYGSDWIFETSKILKQEMIMKLRTICSVILLTCSFISINARSSEDSAKLALSNADDAYIKRQYIECLKYLKDAETNYGTTNSQIQYLKVKALMALGSMDQRNKVIWTKADKELNGYFDVTNGNSIDSVKYKEMRATVGKVTKYLAEAVYEIDSTNINEWTDKSEKEPEDLNILAKITNYYARSGMTDKAIEYLGKAIKIDTANVQLIFTQGCLYEKKGDTTNAIEMYKRSIKVDPKYVNAYYNIGVVYYNRALKLSKNAETATPKETKTNEALTALADEQFRIALEYLEKAHQLKSTDGKLQVTILNIKKRLQKDVN